MTWNAFINWIYSLFIFGDKEIKQVLQNQADAHGLLLQLLSQGTKIMATLQDLQNDLDTIGTALTSIGGVITKLQADLAAALANTAISPEVQAQIDAAFAKAEADKAAALALVPPATP